MSSNAAISQSCSLENWRGVLFMSLTMAASSFLSYSSYKFSMYVLCIDISAKDGLLLSSCAQVEACVFDTFADR